MRDLSKSTPIEILAPAGGWDMVSAAVRCGANAVYLGFGGLNARRNAKGFTPEEFREAVVYCHVRDTAVHLTVNTLVFDGELDQVRGLARLAAETGVDAVIVQDLAVAEIFRQVCPDMPLHGSTQMSVQSVNGAMMLKELGFSRVVLGRELSRKEIREIVESVEIETEVFVHGAHCMSVSGQCIMSAVIGQRSGNRGLCAQPCRLPFTQPGRDQYNLSLKDMSIIPYLTELAEMGVTSVKIEGRMKRPEYVAAAVTACRAALDGEGLEEAMADLEKVFSRSGFTDGYYTGRVDGSMFGIRQKEDVVAAKEVLGRLEKTFAKETPRVPIRFRYIQKENLPVVLEVWDMRGNRFRAEGNLPQRALNKPTDKERVRQNLQKLGGTPYGIEEDGITFAMDEGLAVPVSAINGLRRACVEALDKLRSKGFEKQITGYEIPEMIGRRKSKAPKLRARFLETGEIPWDLAGDWEYLYLPLKQALQLPELDGAIQEKIILEPPRAVFGLEKQVLEDLEAAWKQGFRHLSVQNIGGFVLPQDCGFAIHGGFGLNMTNSLALEQYEKLGLSDGELSLEMDLVRAKALGGTLPLGLTAYGRIPLMLVRNCPGNAVGGCGKCRGQGTMVDRLGNEMLYTCSGYRTAAEILNPFPLYMADRLGELQALDFLILHFTVESEAEIREIHRFYRDGGSKGENITRGLLYRPVY